MLLGSGDFATTADQARLDPYAFSQNAQIALRTMKAVILRPGKFLPLPISFNRSDAVEAYIDFIECLQEAIERQIGNDRAAKSLL